MGRPSKSFDTVLLLYYHLMRIVILCLYLITDLKIFNTIPLMKAERKRNTFSVFKNAFEEDLAVLGAIYYLV